jgi:glycerol uptake facilitator protein
MILILFGVGVVAQVAGANIGDHDSIAWAWGLGVMLGVYVAGRVSGAHLNPAVTLALAAFTGFEWRKVLPYSLAQTAGAFSTRPGNGSLPVGQWGAFRDQIIGTAILLFLILAVTDVAGTPPAANLGPVIVGLIVVAIGMAWGADAGYAIDPALEAHHA